MYQKFLSQNLFIRIRTVLRKLCVNFNLVTDTARYKNIIIINQFEFTSKTYFYNRIRSKFAHEYKIADKISYASMSAYPSETPIYLYLCYRPHIKINRKTRRAMIYLFGNPRVIFEAFQGNNNNFFLYYKRKHYYFTGRSFIC